MERSLCHGAVRVETMQLKRLVCFAISGTGSAKLTRFVIASATKVGCPADGCANGAVVLLWLVVSPLMYTCVLFLVSTLLGERDFCMSRIQGARRALVGLVVKPKGVQKKLQ